MGTECIENTCDTLAEDGSLPDQIRVRPRWYRFSPFRRRLSPTPNADGTPFYDDCGVDLLLVGDDVEDDQLAPTVTPAPVDSEGNLARNGLSRRTLASGQVALFSDPANGHETLVDSAGPITGLTGSVGSEGDEVSLATVSISKTAGAFPLLVRPRIVVCDVRLGYVEESEALTDETITYKYLPAVSYQLRATGETRTETGTATSVGFDCTIGLGGTHSPESFIIPAKGSGTMEVRGSLIYNDDIPATFPIVSAGTIRLDFEIIELTSPEEES